MFERITVFPLYPSSGKSTILQKWGRSAEGWSRNNTNMVISDRACKTTVHIMLKNSYPHTYSMQYANCDVQPCAMCIIIAVTELQQRFSRWRWTDFLIECEKVPFYSWHWKIIKVSLIWLQTWIYSMLFATSWCIWSVKGTERLRARAGNSVQFNEAACWNNESTDVLLHNLALWRW